MKKPVEKVEKTPRTRIRKGDQVVVIAGADRGKTGRVIEVYPTRNRVLVEGVNVAKRSWKKNANPSYPQGGIHDKGMPIHLSNVMFADPKTGAGTRLGVRRDENGRVRVAKASNTDLKD